MELEIGQRYSVMIRLENRPGDCYLRFATYPDGDMQQVLEGQAIMSYNVNKLGYQCSPIMRWLTFRVLFVDWHDKQKCANGCHS